MKAYGVYVLIIFEQIGRLSANTFSGVTNDENLYYVTHFHGACGTHWSSECAVALSASHDGQRGGSFRRSLHCVRGRAGRGRRGDSWRQRYAAHDRRSAALLATIRMYRTIAILLR